MLIDPKRIPRLGLKHGFIDENGRVLDAFQGRQTAKSKKFKPGPKRGSISKGVFSCFVF
jgi:hypothetical protein